MADTRLNEAMEKRRIELRMTWRQVADAAGLSIAGLGAIRRGERKPMALTRDVLEEALRWEPGSVEAVLTGGEPTPKRTPGEPSSRERDEIDEALEFMRAAIAELERIKRDRNAG